MKNETYKTLKKLQKISDKISKIKKEIKLLEDIILKLSDYKSMIKYNKMINKLEIKKDKLSLDYTNIFNNINNII